MKVLGIKQFHQKKFDFLDLSKSKLKDVLGDVPKFFIGVVYGFSGNGKTEFCIQLAKELSFHGKVAWLSYEQRHGSDLQAATIRNKMEERSGEFLVIDPLGGVKPGVSLLEDLDKYLNPRSSPKYIFIDSLDYTAFTWEDYVFLKNKYGEKKGIIFIAHSKKNGTVMKRITEQVIFDGGLSVFVSDFIATPIKNRFGGFEPYVVYEKEARKRNPLFFDKRVKENKTSKQGELFDDPKVKPLGYLQKNIVEEVGVRAEIALKKGGNDA